MNKILFKSTTISIMLVLFSLITIAQGNTPAWVNNNTRDSQYPPNIFYTGFAEIQIISGEMQESAINRAKKTALGELSEQIHIVVSSQNTSKVTSITEKDNKEQFSSEFSSQINTTSQTEVIGSKVETWYDAKINTVYAFAYVNKYELIGYYKANLSLLLQQAESTTQTARELETTGEKSKARKQCEETLPLINKIHFMQNMLTALDCTTDSATLNINKTEQLRDTLTQMQVRLSQAIYVFILGNENLFGRSENIIANKIKADLALKGCSFVDDATKADFKLLINANVRQSSQDEGLVFCYADVEIELYDINKQKIVLGDEFSEKGGSSSQEKAGRKAMSSAAEKIAEKLNPWIAN